MNHEMFEYQPPGPGERGPASMLKIPGITLIVLGALGPIMYGIHILLFAIQSKHVVIPENMTTQAQQTGFWIGYYGCLCNDIVGIPLGLLMIWCGTCMV